MPLSEKTILDYLKLLAFRSSKISSHAMIYWLAIPTKNRNNPNFETKEEEACDFISFALEQLLLHQHQNWLRNLLTVLFKLLDGPINSTNAWFKNILGLILRILQLPSAIKYHIDEKKMLLLGFALKRSRFISWDEVYSKNLIEFSLKKFFTHKEMLSANWISFTGIVFKKILKDSPRVLSETIKNHYLLSTAKYQKLNDVVSESKEAKRNSNWIRILCCCLRILPKLEWNFLSNLDMSLVFNGNYSIQSKLKFWLNAIKARPNSESSSFSSNAIIASLAQPKIRLDSCSSRLKSKAGKHLFKIILQKLPKDGICLSDHFSEDILTALNIFLFLDPENESWKFPSLIKFIINNFGLGRELEKLRLKTDLILFKKLNIQFQNSHTVFKDEKTRLSFITSKFILNHSTESRSLLSDEDKTLLQQLPFGKLFWEIPSWGRYQISVAIELCLKAVCVVMFKLEICQAQGASFSNYILGTVDENQIKRTTTVQKVQKYLRHVLDFCILINFEAMILQHYTTKLSLLDTLSCIL